MTITQLTLFQGDSSDTVQSIVYSNDVQVTGLIAAGYTATFSVVETLGATPEVTKTMTEVSDTFRATLLPADTVGITPGHYQGIVQVINSSLSYKKEDHIDIEIKTQGYQE